MSKYSEKKERQLQEAQAAKQSNGEHQKQKSISNLHDKENKLTLALLTAKEALDNAMIVKELYAEATGGDRSDLESVRGRIVSARDKVASAIARLPRIGGLK